MKQLHLPYPSIINHPLRDQILRQPRLFMKIFYWLTASMIETCKTYNQGA